MSRPRRKQKSQKRGSQKQNARPAPQIQQAIHATPSIQEPHLLVSQRSAHQAHPQELDDKSHKTEQWLAAALALFAFLQVIVAVAQFWAMDQQNTIASGQMGIMEEQIKQTDSILDEMRLDRRAWLSVDSFEISNLEVGKVPAFTIRINNTGKTPAKITSGKVGAFIKPTGEPIDRDLAAFDAWADQNKRGFIVPIDVAFNMGVESGPAITEMHLKHIESGVETLYMAVRFKYLDSFGREHLTQRCVYYEHRKKSLGALSQHDEMD